MSTLMKLLLSYSEFLYSALQLTWLFDNDGIPANWRKMNGFGVNTFKLINGAGEEHLCKFHCLPKGGE